MKPKELIEKLQELPSDLDIAIVEGVTNNHIYDFYSGWTHISGDENYFELSEEFFPYRRQKLFASYVAERYCRKDRL